MDVGGGREWDARCKGPPVLCICSSKPSRCHPPGKAKVARLGFDFKNSTSLRRALERAPIQKPTRKQGIIHTHVVHSLLAPIYPHGIYVATCIYMYGVVYAQQFRDGTGAIVAFEFTMKSVRWVECLGTTQACSSADQRSATRGFGRSRRVAGGILPSPCGPPSNPPSTMGD